MDGHAHTHNYLLVIYLGVSVHLVSMKVLFLMGLGSLKHSLALTLPLPVMFTVSTYISQTQQVQNPSRQTTESVSVVCRDGFWETNHGCKSRGNSSGTRATKGTLKKTLIEDP